MTDIQIRPFHPFDQESARALILTGLADHFEILDPNLNHDLKDIQANFVDRGDLFLVVLDREELIGTGALLRESFGIGRIVRMSVAAHRRREGIGRRLIQELILEARKLNYAKIFVETNDDWFDAIRLYEECGFRPYGYHNGEIHMELII
jgi:GNAT superfamily N-acetyltransferase